MAKKSKVLERKVFQDKDADVENVGIMQGFIDMIVAEEDEPEEEQDVALALGRTPDNPEILMNTLSGEMRSIDARREELADQVGYAAAMETPDSVLALLQVKQDAEGIGGLPQGMPPGMPPMMPSGNPLMMPTASPLPEGIASLPMDQGPMPQPVQMKKGGIVQNFSNGSLSSGVTPVDVDNYVSQLLSKKPENVPTLQKSLPTNIKLLQDLGFGLDEDYLNQQAYLGAASSLFEFANRGDTQELIKNFLKLGASRGALKTKDEQSLKKAALPLAISDRDAAIESNLKLRESQEKVMTKLLDSQNKGFFGSSKEGREQNTVVMMTPKLIEDPSQFTNIQAGNFITSLGGMKEQEKVNRIVEDPLKKIKRVVTDILPSRYDKLPDAYKKQIDLAEKNALAIIQNKPEEINLDVQEQSGVETFEIYPPNVQKEFTLSGTGMNKVDSQPENLEAPSFTPNNNIVLAEKGLDESITPTVKERIQKFSEESITPEDDYNVETLWGYSDDATGIWNKFIGSLARKIPFAGPELDAYAKRKTQAQKFYANSENQFIRALRESGDADRMTEGERKQIKAEIDLSPSVFDNPAFLRDRLIALDNTLISKIRGFNKELSEKELSIDKKQNLISRISELKQVRKKIGLPTRVPTYRKEDGTVDKQKITALLNSLYEQNNFKPFQFLYKDGEGSYKVRIFPVFRSKKGDK
jgi:hypothetical protein